MEYITKKVPKEANALLIYIQAKHQLETGERLNEGQIIYMALKYYAEKVYGFKK